MAPRTRKLGKPKIAFLLDEKRFRQAVEIIEELTGATHLEYTVSLSSGYQITSDSADEILGLQNSRERRFESLWIESPYVSDSLPTTSYSTGARYDWLRNFTSIRERDVSHASARLDEYFSGIRQPYSYFVSGELWKTFVMYGVLIVPIALFFMPWLEHKAAKRATAVGNEEIVFEGANGLQLDPTVSIVLWITTYAAIGGAILFIFYMAR